MIPIICSLTSDIEINWFLFPGERRIRPRNSTRSLGRRAQRGVTLGGRDINLSPSAEDDNSSEIHSKIPLSSRLTERGSVIYNREWSVSMKWSGVQWLVNMVSDQSGTMSGSGQWFYRTAQLGQVTSLRDDQWSFQMMPIEFGQLTDGCDVQLGPVVNPTDVNSDIWCWPMWCTLRSSGQSNWCKVRTFDDWPVLSSSDCSVQMVILTRYDHYYLLQITWVCSVPRGYTAISKCLRKTPTVGPLG